MRTTHLILLLLSFLGLSSSFGPDDPEVQLYMEHGSPKSSLRQLGPNDARSVVEKFLARMTSSIESKDTSIIDGLFQPGFIFKGCKGSYTKQQVVGMISRIPAATRIDFVLKTVEDFGESIKYTVTVSGFGESPLEAEFTLNKIDQQLQSGSIPKCKKSFIRRSQLPVRHDPNHTFRNIVRRLNIVIASRDTTSISKLFDKNFEFTSCPQVYNLARFIVDIINLPYNIEVTYKLIHSKWTEEGFIEGYVSINIPKIGSLHATFVYNPERKVLMSGKKDCETSRKFGGSKRALLANRKETNSTKIVERFLDSLKEIVETRDPGNIGTILDDEFLFRGCRGHYNKNEASKKISSIPVEEFLEFELKSTKYNSEKGQIEFILSVSFLSKNPIEAEFVYCPYKNVLKSGKILRCPAERFQKLN
ncbi:hypothetical protein GCK72_001156 [Caenorhabditis remanei]|uniref:NTF2-like domain-containing protein n=1 Tax=Caenorhabditis remanei TaxID=31234 RepID=A0A6A5HNV4_CAERE|nr:hypothetical protein GCK72_001156 [Caenorhabditis remanei]KAF1769339.1 hypothetical protein GCK72_001156 [Caenorhabditis remanei]